MVLPSVFAICVGTVSLLTERRVLQATHSYGCRVELLAFLEVGRWRKMHNACLGAVVRRLACQATARLQSLGADL